jgi:hypothetical protein
MASKQTRRSISIRGTTYSALRDYCEGHARSMSDVVEELLAGIIDSKPAAKRTVANYVARASSPPKDVAKSTTEEEKAPVQVVSEPALGNDGSIASPAAVKSPMKGELPKPPVPANTMGPGRPAPTPAHKVIAPRQEHAMPKDDYRSINF